MKILVKPSYNSIIYGRERFERKLVSNFDDEYFGELPNRCMDEFWNEGQYDFSKMISDWSTRVTIRNSLRKNVENLFNIPCEFNQIMLEMISANLDALVIMQYTERVDFDDFKRWLNESRIFINFLRCFNMESIIRLDLILLIRVALSLQLYSKDKVNLLKRKILINLIAKSNSINYDMTSIRILMETNTSSEYLKKYLDYHEKILELDVYVLTNEVAASNPEEMMTILVENFARIQEKPIYFTGRSNRFVYILKILKMLPVSNDKMIACITGMLSKIKDKKICLNEVLSLIELTNWNKTMVQTICHKLFLVIMNVFTTQDFGEFIDYKKLFKIAEYYEKESILLEGLDKTRRLNSALRVMMISLDFMGGSFED